jgi:predicted nucleotidyltransferase
LWQHAHRHGQRSEDRRRGSARRARAGAAHPAAEAPGLRARGIASLSLFGSIARGEAGPKSDVDLLIATDPAARLGYFELCALQRKLEAQLRRPVNFAFGSEMRPWLREWIEDDRIGIF